MGPHILLVDDERGLIEYTARRLRARGLTVETAAGGAEAIDEVQKNSIDVVVLDLLMPGMDGVETLKEIKRLSPRTEVVMLTGHGTGTSADLGKEHGALFCLLKPADFGSLLEAIELAYQQSCSHDGAPHGE